MVDSNEYNILLYGESGSGKSTFINALDSYLKYSELETALESNVCSRIAIKFVWENEDYEKIDVEFGYDNNENFKSIGESSTQNLKIHNYPYRKKIFRFIDTPGFNDSRGYEKDVENRNKIVAFFKHFRFQYVHAVCILMKPDENRETLKFRYNIKNILSLFHRNICRNFIFLFTHSAGTDFKPKTTRTILQKMFNEMEAEDNCFIPFHTANCFYIDNDCFRYLITVKLGKDTPDSTDIYGQYWNKSANECIRLLEHVQTLDRSSVQVILSIDRSILKLEELHKDLEMNTREMNSYKTLINQKQSYIDTCTENIRRLRSATYTEKILVRPGPYHMLCTNANCREGGTYGKNGKACCPNCTTWIKSWCFAFEKSSCKFCGCSVDNHELMWIPNFEEKETQKNLVVEAQIQNEEHQLLGYKNEKCELVHKLGEMITHEVQIKCDTAEQISYLKRHGIHVYNNECIQQLELEISNCTDTRIRQRLQNNLKRYQGLYERYRNS